MSGPLALTDINLHSLIIKYNKIKFKIQHYTRTLQLFYIYTYTYTHIHTYNYIHTYTDNQATIVACLPRWAIVPDKAVHTQCTVVR